MHSNVNDSEEVLWREYVEKCISEIAESEGIFIRYVCNNLLRLTAFLSDQPNKTVTS